jgi:hypothetical protein
VNTTDWLKGVRVTEDGTGIVSHAGVVRIPALADNVGLTAGLSTALASGWLLVHDRGLAPADLACAIADGAEVISDFRVMGDQKDLFGLVASVPPRGTRWMKSPAARNRRWAGSPPRSTPPGAGRGRRRPAFLGIQIADRALDGVTRVRLDASMVTRHGPATRKEPSRTSRGLTCTRCAVRR